MVKDRRGGDGRLGRAGNLDCCDVSGGMEDYLKAFVHLAESGETATVSGVSDRVGVSRPSASVMIRRLRDRGLVEKHATGELALSAHGRRHALRVVRRHRLVETFLVEILEMSWDEIHEEAERLEHALSPALEERIAARLGDPHVDPHGDPIPRADEREVTAWPTALRRTPDGAWFRVERVSDRDPDLLRGLTELGITTGTVLQVRRSRVRGPRVTSGVEVEVSGGAVVLDERMADIIHGSVVRAP